MIVKEFFRFILHLYQSRNLLVILALNDFKEQYMGSYLGLFWAILRPVLFVLIIWFIFSVGLKSQTNIGGTPFILYLLCGYVPWFFFAESVTGGMNAIVNNRFLVKKVAFRVSILPLVKIISNLFLHLVFIAILLTLFLWHGYTPTIYWLQLPYYIFCTILFVMGIGWFTSALRVFTKDIGQVIGVLLQLGFWVTPIFWQIKIIPSKYIYLININPMVYIVEGYRSTFINQIWFWNEYKQTTYFIITALFFLLAGTIVFKRLRPHFGDVL